ncbi:hypothetical protein EDD85DRAFT_791966 [Armillaria nabsnona]|nr:hypothetical protein EDD85DRAFT_791966 [Armillaria nabsnona]
MFVRVVDKSMEEVDGAGGMWRRARILCTVWWRERSSVARGLVRLNSHMRKRVSIFACLKKICLGLNTVRGWVEGGMDDIVLPFKRCLKVECTLDMWNGWKKGASSGGTLVMFVGSGIDPNIYLISDASVMEARCFCDRGWRVWVFEPVFCTAMAIGGVVVKDLLLNRHTRHDRVHTELKVETLEVSDSGEITGSQEWDLKRGTVWKEDGSLGLGPWILEGMADGKINEVGSSERYWEYETIEKDDSDPQDAMISLICDIHDDNDCDNRIDNSITPLSMFISIANTQTSHCDNYLLPAIGGSLSDCPVIQYAHRLLVIEKHLGLMLKVEPGTAACKKWMTLDGGANGVHVFAISEDGSRLLGLAGATGKISLNTDCPDFKYDPDDDFSKIYCQLSPDGSKVTLSHEWGFPQTYLLGITPGLSVDIMELKDMRNLVWFPDSKQIAYLQSWRCDHELLDPGSDLE